MNRFEELYNTNPSEAEIRYLKEEFEYGSFSESWEDYYWGAKCITAYDTDDINPKLLIAILHDAFKYGLTVESDKECFIGANKILANVYAILGDHKKIVDVLSSIINVDDNVPAWVFFDYISAQNHTSAIKDNIKNPRVFISLLHHSDTTVSHAEKRQAKIFKDFLVLAADYILRNDVDVDIDTVREAALQYGLLNTQEWAEFVNALSADKQYEDVEKTYELTETSEIESIEVKYQNLLTRINIMQEELDSKNKELENAGNSLRELSQVNSNLEERIKKYSADLAEYEITLKNKDENIISLERKLIEAEEGSANKCKLEEDISLIKKQRAELKDQIGDIKKALNISEQKLIDAKEEIQIKTDENELLKNELEEIRNVSKPFSYSVSADILARCKSFEYMTADKLANWLTRNLSDKYNWWHECVMLRLSYDQAERAKDYNDLHDFDLSALVRITVRNWGKLKRDNFLTESDWAVSDAMFEVRNNLSHNNSKPVVKESIIKDLRILSDFLGMINANSERKQVMLFIKDIAKMQIE